MRLRLVIAAMVAGLLAGSAAWASDFNSRYKVTGRFVVLLDKEPQTFFATVDLETNASSIERGEVMGRVFYTITASTPDANGAPSSPSLQVQIGPGRFPPKIISDIQLNDTNSFSSDLTGGEMALTSAPTFAKDGTLKFTFEGRLVAYRSDGKGNPVVIPEAAVRTISGGFSGVVPLK